MNVDDAGALALFYCTSARYTVEAMESLAVPIAWGLFKTDRTGGGLFITDAKGETTGNEVLLEDFREKLGEKVWAHTTETLEKAIARQ